jgi:serine/threonine protein kinase
MPILNTEEQNKMEQMITHWKEAMKTSNNVVECVDHWFDKENKFIFILMEYCEGGDIFNEIANIIQNNSKYAQQVLLLLLLLLLFFIII